MTDSMVPERWRVARVRRESQDTKTLELEPMGSAKACGFAPGQFNMLYIFGVGEVPISISGNLSSTPRLLHTVRGVGAITRAMSSLKKGSVVGLRGPFGSGWPMESAKGGDIVILAGGIGIAPLRSAINALLRRRKNYGRIVLLYGARRPEELLYPRDLDKWRARIATEVTVDSASSDWRGNVGVVTTLIPRVAFAPNHTTALICGPEIMMQFAVRELQKRGVPEQKIFLSLERNMKCAVGFCGHCQFGPTFVCKDGPVFSYDRIRPWFELREV